MFNRRIFTTLISLSLGLGASGQAFSQLEEITVTARKVGESIQDIPLSITAFGAEDIAKQQIVDIDDIAKFTPGLHMSNRTGDRNDPALLFRGLQGANDSQRQVQTASPFIDGVYLPGSSQFVGMNDIERVEVVKGPQSAFFGRATFGGAVNYITKTPGNEWGGDVRLIAGDNSRADFWASVEGPVIEDKLAFRASGRLYTYDGAWDNNFPGSQNLGAQETSSLSLTLYATPTENISIKLRHLYDETRDGPGTMWLIRDTFNCGPFDPTVPRAASYYCGELDSSQTFRGNLDIDTSVDLSTPGASWSKSEMGLERFVNLTSLDINVDIGGYTLSSLTAQYTDDNDNLRELLSGELLVATNYRDEMFSQEFRLASPEDKRLRWMVGLYYLDLEYGDQGFGYMCPGDVVTFFCGPTTPRGAGTFGGSVQSLPTATVENTAIFGSVTFDITEKLTASLEIRRAEEDLANTQPFTQEAPPTDFNDPINTARPRGGAMVTPSTTLKATTPRVILDYKFTDNTVVYGSYSEGNNPGGFNNDVIEMDPTAQAAFTAMTGVGVAFDEAELKQYEVGVKHTLANGKGYVNGAAYFLDWNNQGFRGFFRDIDSNGDGVFVLGSDRIGTQVDYIDNGSTDITGFELSAGYALTENWLASVAWNYNKTDIQTYEDATLARVVGSNDAAGREIARSPKNSGTVAVDFNMPANIGGGGAEWFARWDAYYQSATYAWVINLAETPPATLHNLRGGWRNDRYSVMAWIENLTDDDSPLAAARTTGSFATGTLGFNISLPEPRTFGVTFSARFGE